LGAAKPLYQWKVKVKSIPTVTGFGNTYCNVIFLGTGEICHSYTPENFPEIAQKDWKWKKILAFLKNWVPFRETRLFSGM